MFDRLIKLIGKENFDKIQNKNILLIGLGGVGGTSFESLIRNGIKNITIVDGDIVDVSNLNRQIISTNDVIGLKKVEVAKKRALSINNEINIKIIDYYLTEDNFKTLNLNEYDYVIDACDDIKIKLLLIQNANKYKLISSMGTANKFNPELFKITTIDKTTNDPIARKLRKLIKDNKINTKFKVVSSIETVHKTNELGTNSYIPSIAGLLLTSYVINNIIKK